MPLLILAGLFMTMLALFPGPVLGGATAFVLVVVAGGASVAVLARRHRNQDHGGWVMLSRPQGETYWKIDWVPAILTGLSVAGILAWLGAPGLYTKDAGELATAVHVLGVPHPTGFPLFCLFGKTFDLMPLGSVFFRINLLSAVSIGIAAAASFLLVRLIESRDSVSSGGSASLVVALIAPLGFLASHTVWLHGTTTEVYGLSVAGLALTLLAWLAAWMRGDARLALLGAFLSGLGFGGHITWPVFGIMVGGIVVAAAIARRRWPPKLFLALVLAGIAGVLVVAYLPIAASREPVMNWGDPSNPSSLWAHLSGARIRRSFEGTIGTGQWGALLAHFESAFRVLWEGTGPLWPLAVAGLVSMVFGAGRIAAIALGAVLLADIAFAAWINPMGVRDLQTMTSATLVLAVLAASGVAGLHRLAGSRKSLKGIVLVTGLLAVGFQAGMAPADRDMRMVHAPREVAQDLLHRLPVGASLLTTTDSLSATIIAIQAVEGARPDILALVRQHIGDTRYVSDRLVRHGGLPGEGGLVTALAQMPFEQGGEAPEQAIPRAVALLGKRGSVFVEPGESRTDAPLRSRFEPGFPVYRVAEGGTADGLESARQVASQVRTFVPDADRWTRAWLAGKLGGLGTLFVMRGRADVGRELLADAVGIAPKEPRLLYNLAVVLMGEGRAADAAVLLRRSVAADPSYARAWSLLSRAAEQAGSPLEAERAGRKARSLSRE